MRDLSVLIPSRNEMFLRRTIEDILEHKEADTEVIAVLDGQWADPVIDDHKDVTLIYHSKSVGQRVATNEAAKISTAKFIMKCDAHCAFDQGFDRKLMEDCEYDWTVIPRMYNLHGFDWVCDKCGDRRYQSPTPTKCNNAQCDNTTEFTRNVLWKPRFSRRTDFARFDKDMHFQYWGACEKRPESQGDIADTMCHVGAGWFMHRERYWDLGGLDERHGSWGQMGVEISCKSWLSGGRQVVNKKTWFAHMFRTQGGDFGFPYPQSVDRWNMRGGTLGSCGKVVSGREPRESLIMAYLRSSAQCLSGMTQLCIRRKIKGLDVPSATMKPGATLVYYSDNNPDSLYLDACKTQCYGVHGTVGLSNYHSNSEAY